MILQTLLAVLPIAWLIISLGVLKMPGTKACLIGLLLTLGISIVGFDFPIIDAFTATLEGVINGIWPIVYIIVAALFTYNLATYSGSMKIINQMLTGVSKDMRVLVLLIAWGFGGFLESIAGFGTAVAIPAGILASLGVSPVMAAVICLIANTTPTAFGAIGLPVTSLAQAGGLEVMQTSYIVSLQLFLLILIVPFILIMLSGESIKALKGVTLITLLSGLAFGLPQIFVARYIGPELPAVIGSLICILVTVLAARFVKTSENSPYLIKDNNHVGKSSITFSVAFRACLPYIFVFLFIILSSSLFPAISGTLGKVQSSFVIYSGEGAKPYVIKWLTTPGTLIILATYLGGLIQGVSFGKVTGILWSTIKQLKNTAVTVSAIVALSKLMGYSGMISVLSTSLVTFTGSLFPLISPLIGAVGTFITGSDTNANVLFGSLQVNAAQSLGANEYWLASANMAGATAGKMISPQSIAVATAATGLIGQEGAITKKVFKYFALYLGVICLIVFFLGKLLGMI
ncbi:MAG: L-lactate permease [Leuconostoc mesenteroides]|uniref:L-lactate permease n=1 Tax=Carnobacterium TaxID=2747 RepID=UPI00203F3426|nr:L-lactate permease [Carnobacterium inhibens]MCM3512502.1 L-lactate permease [Carnobacterium inhibens]